MWDYNLKYYLLTHHRIGPFLVGILTGYLMAHKRISGKKLSSKQILLALILSPILAYYSLFYSFNNQLNNRLDKAIYLSSLRIVWSIVVCIIIYVSAFFHNQLISKLFHLSGAILISKISYAIYLLHYPIQLAMFGNLKYPIDLQGISGWSFMFTSAFITIILSLLMWLTIERPFIKMYHRFVSYLFLFTRKKKIKNIKNKKK